MRDDIKSTIFASMDREKVAADLNAIIMALASSDDPLATTFKFYDRSADKDIFVAALAASLLLRHRQWQVCNAQPGKGRQ